MSSAVGQGLADPNDGAARLPVFGRVARRWPEPWSRAVRLGRFGLVGMSGFFVNEAALAAFVSTLGVNYLVGAVLATQLSSLWNFALVEVWAFRTHEARRPMRQRLGLFLAVNNVALLLRGPILFALTSWLGVNYLVSNLVSLGVLTVVRFAVADSWIWGAATSTDPTGQEPVVDEAAVDGAIFGPVGLEAPTFGSLTFGSPTFGVGTAPAAPAPVPVRFGRVHDVVATPPPPPSVPPRAPTRFVRVPGPGSHPRNPVTEPTTAPPDDAA